MTSTLEGLQALVSERGIEYSWPGGFDNHCRLCQLMSKLAFKFASNLHVFAELEQREDVDRVGAHSIEHPLMKAKLKSLYFKPEVRRTAECHQMYLNAMGAATSLAELKSLSQRDLYDLEDPSTTQFIVYTTQSKLLLFYCFFFG